MKKFWLWLFSRSTIVVAIAIMSALDLGFSYWAVKYHAAQEYNPILNFFLKKYGPEWTFLFCGPTLIFLGLLILNWTWHYKNIGRWTGYVFFVVKICVLIWHLYNFYVISSG